MTVVGNVIVIGGGGGFFSGSGSRLHAAQTTTAVAIDPRTLRIRRKVRLRRKIRGSEVSLPRLRKSHETPVVVAVRAGGSHARRIMVVVRPQE